MIESPVIRLFLKNQPRASHTLHELVNFGLCETTYCTDWLDFPEGTGNTSPSLFPAELNRPGFELTPKSWTPFSSGI